MIQRIEFAQDQVDWLRQPEIPHVAGHDPERQAETARLLTAQPALSGGETQAIHLDALASQRDGRCSRPTCQVTCGFELGENPAEDALPCLLVPGKMKVEELVVILCRHSI